MTPRSCSIIVSLLLVALTGGLARAQAVPGSISYQGKLTDSTGKIVPDDTYSMQFKLFDAPTGGNLLWDSGAMSVSTSGGVFTVQLQTITSSTLTKPDVWLETTVTGKQIPRVKLSSAPFALRAGDITLPFARSLGDPGILFSITNTSTGSALRGSASRSIRPC